MYSNLVLSGGAFKAISLLGSIKYLENIDILKNFKQFIGTSAGGVIVFFIIIGYTSDDIKEILINEMECLTNLNIDNITDFLEDFGIEDSSKNKIILKKYLFNKTGLNEITFIEFTKKFGINLIITGSNLTTRELNYFNIDNTPNMNIIDALLITTCLPIINKPIKYNDFLYLDGALYNNFALDYFKNKSNDTLGICVSGYYSNKNENVVNYFYNIIFSMMDKLTYDNISKNKYNICSIYFDKSKSNDIDFSLENMKINIDNKWITKYYNYGYDEFKKYYINLQKNKILEIDRTLKIDR
jgi:predicted acylesterase/phospholipase RssA